MNEVATAGELRDLRRQGVVFCLLAAAAVYEPEDLSRLQRLAMAAGRTPCLLWGRVPQELAAPLVRAGFDELVRPYDTEILLEKLRALQVRATFRVEWSEFGIDVEGCGYWTQRYLNFVLDEHNFLRFSRVSEVAAVFGVSVRTLEAALHADTWMAPKYVLSILKHYYAAYLLTVTDRPAMAVAAESSLDNERDFYKSFRRITGLTPATFRQQHHWSEYPALVLAQRKERGRKNQ